MAKKKEKKEKKEKKKKKKRKKKKKKKKKESNRKEITDFRFPFVSISVLFFPFMIKPNTETVVIPTSYGCDEIKIKIVWSIFETNGRWFAKKRAFYQSI